MPNFDIRSAEPEIMDDFKINDEGLKQTLKELEFINFWLGGNAITIEGVKELLEGFNSKDEPITIVDWGCGSGDMLRLIAQKFRNTPLKLIGIDANPAVIEFAKERSKNFPQISFSTANVLSDEFKKEKFDIILCTLFTHHFENQSLVNLLSQMKQQAKIGVVINDLHRHWFAYHSIDWLTRLFSKSYMTKYDAKLSVLRGFSREELKKYLEDAGWQSLKIHWKWAFRWKVILKNQS
jgi:ubiquinone/menaquinone biosynthesis C-methylase UbiE